MTTRRGIIVFAFLAFSQLSVISQDESRAEIILPDIPGYSTLKCDFHMHTVFSDGSVWPDFRVREAWRAGLDAIAITDHIEYLPHKSDIRTNHNRSYEIAKGEAARLDMVLIKASEITRKMPPGHLNALFLSDSKVLDTANWEDAVKAAADQGAYIFWNHPGWKAQQPDTMRWFPEHSRLVEQGYIKGIEIINFQEWYPEALHWAVTKKLSILGNSDSHDPVNFEFNTFPRPMTLVFAEDKTEKGVQEALLARRTAGYFRDTLMGSSEYLAPLFQASVKLTSTKYKILNKSACIQIRNYSSIPYIIELTPIDKKIKASGILTIPALKTATWTVNITEYENKSLQIPVKVTVKNMLTDEDTPLVTTFLVTLDR